MEPAKVQALLTHMGLPELGMEGMVAKEIYKI